MILPNFLVIGAQKAGTTTLTKFLRQHPDVCFSRPKETWFFDKRYGRGLEWFASHFEHYNEEQAIGEGTARLLQCEAAPERIANDLGNPRLICILRDPVDRAFSQYHLYIQTGKADPDKSFSEVIRDEESAFGQDIIRQGCYIDQLERYEDVFGRNQLTVVLHRDLRESPVELVRSLYRTLGVDPQFQPNANQEHNVTSYPRSRAGYAMIRSAWHVVRDHGESRMPGVTDTLRNTVCTALFDTEKPQMSEKDRRFLQNTYQKPNRRLKMWLDADLSHWT